MDSFDGTNYLCEFMVTCIKVETQKFEKFATTYCKILVSAHY
jgi:hypothetical protein